MAEQPPDPRRDPHTPPDPGQEAAPDATSEGVDPRVVPEGDEIERVAAPSTTRTSPAIRRSAARSRSHHVTIVGLAAVRGSLRTGWVRQSRPHPLRLEVTPHGSSLDPAALRRARPSRPRLRPARLLPAVLGPAPGARGGGRRAPR